jgi:hypothetical protein
MLQLHYLILSVDRSIDRSNRDCGERPHSAGIGDAREELLAGGVLHDDGEVGRRQDDLELRIASRSRSKRVIFFSSDTDRNEEQRQESPRRDRDAITLH